ncbi:MAG: SLC13 family permease [Natronomonas sp.]|uniref:SLC13 family permease n=1 Tax=Natronomonas sp. TaxID=2184060 RepID=UPI00286FF0D2|nr:SLC13 family permease [Natronomonas sp.]MDR9381094.1 SLC13 family permease [Natronomonas sp.]MDR9430156.1 SLC13 family permease [Natronomonas sp.]
MVVDGVTTGVVVVFCIILAALALFVSEVIPNDVTAIGVIGALVIFEPWTGVGARAAISGFANPATVTIVAMYMLSAGIQNTGIVHRLGVYLADFTAGNEFRALVATVGTTGPIAGFINNTPVVAVFIPMISDLADEAAVSPSKLLLPLSYAAILGGTLTLIGTSTNILASEYARTLIDGRSGIGMFEFTPLGIVILAVGLAYLLTIGRRLTPARIPAESDLVEEFDLDDHLAVVSVSPDSPAVGMSVEAFSAEYLVETRILQIRRNGEVFAAPRTDQRIEAGDQLVVHGTLQAVNRLGKVTGLKQILREDVTEETFIEPTVDETLARAVVPEESAYVGETIAEARIAAFHDTTVLAIRRGDELLRTDLDERTLRPGDLLLVWTTPTSIEYFTDSGELVIAHEEAYDKLAKADVANIAPLSSKTPIAVGIMAGVVGATALGLLPIVIAALVGVFAMIVTGCLSAPDAYDAVSWNVIFLLAGVIPLGVAMEATGGAALLAELVVVAAGFVPLLAVLFLFYLVTGLLASVITPVATIVLMIPVAVDAAVRLDANAFSFVLAAMFAAATSFMTPVGYQTNLMVYGPGGYRFSDFLRVGGPLQLLISVVTTLGIAFRWGV